MASKKKCVYIFVLLAIIAIAVTLALCFILVTNFAIAGDKELMQHFSMENCTLTNSTVSHYLGDNNHFCGPYLPCASGLIYAAVWSRKEGPDSVIISYNAGKDSYLSASDDLEDKDIGKTYKCMCHWGDEEEEEHFTYPNFGKIRLGQIWGACLLNIYDVQSLKRYSEEHFEIGLVLAGVTAACFAISLVFIIIAVICNKKHNEDYKIIENI